MADNPGAFNSLKYNNFGGQNFGFAKASPNSVVSHVSVYKNMEGIDFATRGPAYVFFVPPDINLYARIGSPLTSLDVFTTEVNKTPQGKEIIRCLDSGTIKGGSSGKLFINLLTNMAKTFELKDTALETIERENFIGYKISNPTTTTQTVTSDSFTIDYSEERELPVLKLHKIWVDYMHYVKRGLVLPKKSYMEKKIVDYMGSVYFFSLGEDGQEIKYWSKYTGVYPINVPYSGMSWHGLGDNGFKDLSITYNYNFKEDLDYEILSDFAAYTGGLKGNGMIMKEPDISKNWRGNPGISKKNGKFYLVFN